LPPFWNGLVALCRGDRQVFEDLDCEYGLQEIRTKGRERRVAWIQDVQRVFLAVERMQSPQDQEEAREREEETLGWEKLHKKMRKE
jgi:hypothetical protein